MKNKNKNRKGMVTIKRQAALLALMTALFLLVGCSQSAQLEEDFTNWKTAFLEQTEHDITADIISTIDDKHGEYTISYHLSPEEETIQVLAPELIADVKAHMEGKEKPRLSFDGVMLETGSGIGQRLSPLTALPIFMDFLTEGHLEDVWTEESDETELLVSELELSDGSKMNFRQNKSDMTPLCAAIRTGSSVEIKISFT